MNKIQFHFVTPFPGNGLCVTVPVPFFLLLHLRFPENSTLPHGLYYFITITKSTSFIQSFAIESQFFTARARTNCPQNFEMSSGIYLHVYVVTLPPVGIVSFTRATLEVSSFS